MISMLCNAATLYVTPEEFGAKADGIHDDAPAFNKCIRTGKKIVLAKGRRYMIHGRLDWINSNSFELQGNDATIILASDYPLKEYDQIIGFSDHEILRSFFVINNLRIESHFGRKFSDRSRRGDTYIICLGRCERAEVRNVVFEDFGEYNNVSFLVNTGANLVFSDCKVKSHSHSEQGGALWVMNKYLSTMSLDMRRVDIDYDTKDECFCISLDPATALKECWFKASVRDCTFTGPGQVQSSGFFIEHTNTSNVISHFDVRFKGCTFVSKGKYPHRIVFYQSGTEPRNEFKTVYKKCCFEYAPKVKSELGLISMVPMYTGLSPQNVYTSFQNCVFNVKNVCSIIGDKDGETAGLCTFRNCSVNTDGELFVRVYNPGAGNVRISTRGGTMHCGGEFITTESMDARRTEFSNGSKDRLKVWKVGLSKEPLPVKMKGRIL